MTTLKTTHLTEAEELLIEQLKDKPNFLAMLRIFIDKIQEIENVLDDVQRMRWIDEATNIQLDVLGAIVGVERNGREDDAYRIVIKAHIRANYASGIPEDFFEVFSLLLGDDAVVELRDFPPAGFTCEVSNGGGGALSEAEATEVVAVFSSLRAAGVEGQLIYSLVDDDESFVFSDTTEDTSTTQGFTDTDEDATDGGALASVEN
jgi:hypothetical protein